VLCTIAAKRLKIPIFHMEAGNRCFDQNVPEEINRKIIDHVSDINLPYTNRSSYNLIKEGIDRNKIYVTGNPIYEVIKKNWKNINLSKVLSELKLINKDFFLITLHRQENVDCEIKLRSILKEIDIISKNFKIPVIWPIHPRTSKNLIKMKINIPKTIVLLKPLGFFDFVNLEIHSKLIFTDSGTVQEEALIFKKICIILRDTTERPETIEAGSGILYNNNINNINDIINHSLNTEKKINIVEEYFYEDVSNKIINIMLSE
jgi:UDP-N-acetylglucosamine 2-epimerase (non-hydrolysing)